MSEELKLKLQSLFAENAFSKFKFNELTCSIDLDRSDNSDDSLIFNELGLLTGLLMGLDIEFSIANDGTIILESA